MANKGHAQRAVCGEGFVVAAADLLHAGDHPHRRGLAVGEAQCYHRAVRQQPGAFRVGGVQQVLEVGDAAIDERQLLGLLDLVGRVAAISTRILVVLEPTEQAGAALS
jgi:hypothetical protein